MAIIKQYSFVLDLTNNEHEPDEFFATEYENLIKFMSEHEHEENSLTEADLG